MRFYALNVAEYVLEGFANLAALLDLFASGSRDFLGHSFDGGDNTMDRSISAARGAHQRGAQ
jgi:hypothetical protein